MSIERSYNKTVEIDRLSDDESGDGESYALHLAEVACMIQPQDDRYSEDVDGNFGKDFMMFCNIADIKEGDRVIDGDDEYRVVGIESYAWGGNPHMEATIRIFNP